jgi:hypothetical protein
MTILVWPFVEADDTWKTFSVKIGLEATLPVEHRRWDWTAPMEFSGFPEIVPPLTYDGPSHDGFKNSQYRLSSNFNSRKALGLSKKRLFPKSLAKRQSFFGKRSKDPFFKKSLYSSSALKKVLRCSVPKWKTHEYVESGKFRVQRRWSNSLLRYVETRVPMMVRKIVLIPGRKIGDLKTNALWYEEHQRVSTVPLVNVVRNYVDPNTLFFGNSAYFESFEGPWSSIPSTVSSPLGQHLHSLGTEFTAACLAITPKILLATEIQALDDKVVAKLYSKLLDQKVDLATALAEGAKTVSTITDLLMRLLQFILGLYRLDPSKVTRGILGLFKDLLPLNKKRLANDFLAYRYGITPLMSDISGSVKQIAEYFDSEPKVFARSRKKQVIDNSSYEWEPTSFGFERMRVQDVTTIEVAYKVTYAIEDLGSRRLAELGFTNPVNVNWELTPFSFVIDWFLPIGNYLRDMSSASGLRFKECSRTTVIRKNQTRVYQHILEAGAEYPGDWLTEPGPSWMWSTEDFYCYREIIPVPELPLPSFKNPFSVGHVLNGIALLVQIFKR